MKNRTPSMKSLPHSPYGSSSKSKTPTTPLRSPKVLGIRQISNFETTIFSTPQRQNPKLILRPQFSCEGKLRPAPIKDKTPLSASQILKSSNVQEDINILKNISNLSEPIQVNKKISVEIMASERSEYTEVHISDFLQATKTQELSDKEEFTPTNELDLNESIQIPFESNIMKLRVYLPELSHFQPDQQNESIENSVSDRTKRKVIDYNIKEEQEDEIKEELELTKEGYLMKKSSLFFGWEKQYFKVDSTKIYYAPTRDLLASETNAKCLNLLANPCELGEQKGQEFSVLVKGTDLTLALKANSIEEANDWIEFLKEQFTLAQFQQGKYLPNQVIFQKSNVIVEEEFLNDVETGDILLLKSNHFAAKMQRLFTSSEYDHLGLMLRAKDDVYLYDSSMGSGVQLTSWADFKKEKQYLTYPTIAFRKLKIQDANLKKVIQDKLWDFVTMHVGKKYELNMKKLFRKPSFSHEDTIEAEKSRASVDLNTTLEDICHIQDDGSIKNLRSLSSLKRPSSGVYRDTDEGFFCSELIAAAFKTVGLLDTVKSSTRYLPVSFSQKRDLNLLKGASLSKEYDLALLHEH